MRKVTTRAYSLLVLVAITIVGMGIYLFRYARDGGDWASFYANDSVYTNGVLNRGTVTDRDGVILAAAGEDGFRYADTYAVRRACLHVLGDLDGNIGTGILNIFRPEMIHYSFLTGTTREGGSFTLTIDADVSAAAYNALSGRKGTVLVYNYETGEVLCMVSAPGWDPAEGIHFNMDDPAYEGAFINRAISSTFVPGSIFKLVTMAAAIENIPDIWNQTFTCTGSDIVGGQTVNCAGTHGTIYTKEALAVSCNVAFAHIATELGGELISSYAEKYGLTNAHTLNKDIPTAAGSVPVADSVADTAWEGIGQYKDLINPYALLRFVGAIANGGKVVEPTMIAGKKCGETDLINPTTAQILSEMMSYDVTYEYGTWAYPGLEMHAKTGTAEVGDGTSHAWFAGFITNTGYPLAFVVMVERAGSGYGVASPIANAVLQTAVSD